MWLTPPSLLGEYRYDMSIFPVINRIFYGKGWCVKITPLLHLYVRVECVMVWNTCFDFSTLGNKILQRHQLCFFIPRKIFMRKVQTISIVLCHIDHLVVTIFCSGESFWTSINKIYKYFVINRNQSVSAWVNLINGAM